MGDFDKNEWRLENGVVEGKDWHLLRRKPESEFCDVRLKDGRETGPCWPRATDFVDLSSDDEQEYPFSHVSHVRYYISKTDAEADPDDEDGDDEEGSGEREPESPVEED